MDYEITAIIDRYHRSCKDVGCPPNKFISKVFDEERKSATKQAKESMHLRLCGNNYMLTDTRLTDNDIIVLFDSLSHNEYITRIDLRYNQITDKGAEVIAQYLASNPYLQELDLMCNDIEEAGALALAKSLQTNENLLSLRLNGNRLGRRGGMAFAQVLQINTALLEIDLGETDQKIDSLIAVATVLRENTTVRAVNLNRPLLFTHQEEHIVHFSNMLKVNRGLVELHVQKCELKDFGATRLSEALMDNMTLQYLDISCNRVTRDGAAQLAKLLARNSALRVLDLGHNRVEDDGAIALAEALAMMNASLTRLSVKHNNIGDAGVAALADAMQLNTTVTNLYVWGNQWEPNAAGKLGALRDSGRFGPDDVDVHPYVVDDVSHMAEKSNSLRPWYYAEPFYNADAVTHPSAVERFEVY